MSLPIFTSLARIASFGPFEIAPLPRPRWAWGDYVAVEVVPPLAFGPRVERLNGRLMQVAVGDRLIGALGTRYATLELTGTWEEVGSDGIMQVLSGGGMLGRMTSISPMLGAPISVRYLGHVREGGSPRNMSQYAVGGTSARFSLPVVLVAGSSMSAGKTSTAALAIRRLERMGVRTVGLKLTGAGRYRDILDMHDAGARQVFDFVDAGMPSTVCSEIRYTAPIERLLSTVAGTGAEVAVVEVGASPLEPYNGDVAFRLLEPYLRMMILCASDPYSVVGIIESWGHEPDLVAGVACNTDAGRALTERLTGIQSLRLLDPSSVAVLDGLLRHRLSIDTAAA